ncbi:MAG: RnfABCDGE type electron transport complex subunit G [Lachnospiraceae bacterium]|nr:RnfABCDGE type electron transport complex subunit G [Lachnospiraceae bacterium]
MQNEILKNTVIITVIALICGVLLGTVYQVTAGPIAEQERLTKENAYREVMENAASFEEYAGFDEEAAKTWIHEHGDYHQNTSVSEVIEAKDASGASIGYVLNVVAGGGYGGDIVFAMGIDNDGNVTGISITQIDETPGLGMRAKTDPSFLEQFYGKGKDAFTLGDDINALTSATFTSRAVTNGVNAALNYYGGNLK